MHPKRIKRIPANKLRPIANRLARYIEVWSDGHGELSEIAAELFYLLYGD